MNATHASQQRVDHRSFPRENARSLLGIKGVARLRTTTMWGTHSSSDNFVGRRIR
jgi:hypothetical protein